MPDPKKKNRVVIELQDLKPKKDARGGIIASVNANVGANVSNNRTTDIRNSNRGASGLVNN